MTKLIKIECTILRLDKHRRKQPMSMIDLDSGSIHVDFNADRWLACNFKAIAILAPFTLPPVAVDLRPWKDRKSVFEIPSLSIMRTIDGFVV